MKHVQQQSRDNIGSSMFTTGTATGSYYVTMTTTTHAPLGAFNPVLCAAPSNCHRHCPANRKQQAHTCSACVAILLWSVHAPYVPSHHGAAVPASWKLAQHLPQYSNDLQAKQAHCQPAWLVVTKTFSL
jgi:hypothetical protein